MPSLVPGVRGEIGAPPKDHIAYQSLRPAKRHNCGHRQPSEGTPYLTRASVSGDVSCSSTRAPVAHRAPADPHAHPWDTPSQQSQMLSHGTRHQGTRSRRTGSPGCAIIAGGDLQIRLLFSEKVQHGRSFQGAAQLTCAKSIPRKIPSNL